MHGGVHGGLGGAVGVEHPGGGARGGGDPGTVGGPPSFRAHRQDPQRCQGPAPGGDLGGQGGGDGGDGDHQGGLAVVEQVGQGMGVVEGVLGADDEGATEGGGEEEVSDEEVHAHRGDRQAGGAGALEVVAGVPGVADVVEVGVVDGDAFGGSGGAGGVDDVGGVVQGARCGGGVPGCVDTRPVRYLLAVPGVRGGQGVQGGGGQVWG